MSAAPHVWVGNWLYRRFGGWISGHFLTTLFNNITWRRGLFLTMPFLLRDEFDQPFVRSINTCDLLLGLDAVAELFNNIAFGDDNILYLPDCVRPDGSQLTTADLALLFKRRLGWKITNADKTDPYENPLESACWTDISFLKRMFVPHNHHRYITHQFKHVYMPLELDSIRKSLNYTDSNSNAETLKQVVDGALCQLSYHGIEAWDKYALGIILASERCLDYSPRNENFRTALFAERS